MIETRLPSALTRAKKTTKALFRQQTARRLILYFLLFAIILCGSMLLAVQVRLDIAVQRSAPGALPALRLDFNTPVDGTGWYAPEGESTWTSARQATLRLPPPPARWYEIRFRVTALTDAIENSLQLDINGTEISLSRSTDADSWMIFRGLVSDRLLAGLDDDQELLLTFRVSGITSPQAQGLGVDGRLLGMRFDWLEFAPVLPPAVQPPQLFLLLGLVAGWGAVAALQIRRARLQWHITRLLFGMLVLVALVAGGLSYVLIRDISDIQVLAFVVISIAIGFAIILWAPTPTVYGKPQTLISHLLTLWENRFLLAIWTRYNISSRYSQAFLGILWIVLQPLAISIILAFVFSQILRTGSPEGVPYVAFFLVAMIPWTFFNQAVMLSSNSLITSSNLLAKVFFPREIIVIIKLFEALIDTGFMFVAMLVINWVVGVRPTPTFVYLPVLLLIQAMLVLGIMLFVSYLSLMIRDIPQLVQIVLRFMFYLTPILYPSSAIPAQFSALSLFNPLAPLIDAYRDVILYNTAPNWITLYYPLILAGVLLYTGYMFFKKNEKRLADYL